MVYVNWAPKICNFFITLYILFSVLSNDNNGQRIVCYVQGQAVYRRKPQTFRPEDLNPFACTHVIYAFAAMDPHSFQITPNDEEYDLIQGNKF